VTQPPSDHDGELDEPLPDSIWEALGLPEPRRSDDQIAPAVDRDLLVRLVRKQLPDDAARALYRLIHAFQSWNDAYAEVVVENFRRSQGESENDGS
jgi:hypothetical protein